MRLFTNFVRAAGIFSLLFFANTLSGQNLNANGSLHQISYTGSYEEYKIPNTGSLGNKNFIYFYLKGADGGKRRVGLTKKKGGGGATVDVRFKIGTGPGELQPGGKVRFIVGHKGDSYSGSSIVGAGGGGGTAILYKNPGATVTCNNPSTDLADADNCWVILAVAGGGGGAYQSGLSDGSTGKSGNNGTCGKDGGGLSGGDGGCNGNGGDKAGSGSGSIAGGGGGYLTNGGGIGDNKAGKKGKFTGGSGGTDYPDGGFGYGGGGSGRKANTGNFGGGVGGGGGGGFSGGGGGETNGGGGGGSFANSAAVSSDKDDGGKDGSPDNGKLSYQFLKKDPSGPVAKCKDISVRLDGGDYVLSGADVNDGSVAEPGESIDFFFTISTPIGVLASNILTLDCADVGESMRRLTVQSSSGKLDYCTFNLEIEDDGAPTVNCVSSTIIAPVGPDQDFVLTTDMVELSSSDNCGLIVNKSLSKEIFTCEDAGEIDIITGASEIVTLYVEDNSGNVSSCEVSVRVEALPATLSCPSDITMVLEEGTCTASIAENLAPDYYLECGSSLNYVLNVSPDFGIGQQFTGGGILESFDFPAGVSTITYSLSNPFSNCSFTVNVQDQEAPTARCRNITINPTAAIANLASRIGGNSTDNCGLGLDALSLSKSNFDCGDIGENEVTLTVKDASGNESTCAAVVFVADDTAPDAFCQDITVQLDDNGHASITATDVNKGSFDNCGIADLILDQTDFNCSNIGPNIVDLQVLDGSGNKHSCTATVTVEENTAPVAACRDMTIQLDANGHATISPEDIDAGSSDNCGIADLSLSRTSFACIDIDAHNVTLTVTDASGHTSSCTSTVIVTDDDFPCNLPPVAVCQDITVALNANCQGMAFANDFDGGSTDPDLDELTFSVSSAGPYPEGITTVTLTVSDGELSATCSATITVSGEIMISTVAPAKLWPADHSYQTFTVEQMISSISGSCDADVSAVWIESASSDETEDHPSNYDGSTLEDIVLSDDCRSVQLRRERMSYGNGRVYTITLAYQDATGNVTNIDYTVSVPRWPWGWFSNAVDDGAMYTENCGGVGGAAMTSSRSRSQAMVLPGSTYQGSELHMEVYPNPFYSETKLKFHLSEKAFTTIRIFNLQGQMVKQLYDGYLGQGEHQQVWDGTDASGATLPSGMYLIQLRMGNKRLNKKVLLQRF